MSISTRNPEMLVQHHEIDLFGELLEKEKGFFPDPRKEYLRDLRRTKDSDQQAYLLSQIYREEGYEISAYEDDELGQEWLDVICPKCQSSIDIFDFEEHKVNGCASTQGGVL